MLGGGNYTTQNKILPGTYINFISAKKTSINLSERGTVAIAMELDFGKDEEIMKISAEDFEKNSLKLLGYEYNHNKLKGLRDLFLNATTLYLYKLNKGEKASNKYATAKYSGIRGNDIKIIIQENLDETSKFDVITMIESKKVDTQTVASSAELVNNDFVDFKTDAVLEATAGMSLEGGTSGNAVTGENHQVFLDKLENYSFNALGCLAKDSSISNLYVAFTKRMRNGKGVKFQTVVYNNSADFEGIINLKNKATEDETALIFYTVGIIAGCAINKSNTNKIYNGEYTVEADYTQTELESAILCGEFVYHKVGDEFRVLEDINSLVTVTDEKREEFKANQTIRVLDQIATDTAIIFNNKYLGKIQNNEAGRISLWNDIVTIYKEYATMQAIENFDSKDIEVQAGNDKKSVVISGAVQPINSMEKLYMTVVIE